MPASEVKVIVLALLFGGIFFVAPLIGMLLRHQREMTKLLRQDPNPDLLNEIASLKMQLAELRDRQNTAILANENAKDVRHRLEVN